MAHVTDQAKGVADKLSGAAASAKTKVDDATASARVKASKAASNAKEKFDQAGDTMKSAASEARKKYAKVKKKVSSADYSGMTDDLRSYVRQNPGKAIIVAAAAGFLVGLLLRDSEE
ncbi:MAG: hypothetical protein R3338_02840 [Thermoanaerobaculia bacterium]|nr:hypothetical protein [Thermoanaerobaculia bacterium]